MPKSLIKPVFKTTSSLISQLVISFDNYSGGYYCKVKMPNTLAFRKFLTQLKLDNKSNFKFRVRGRGNRKKLERRGLLTFGRDIIDPLKNAESLAVYMYTK